ncbi:hypothetical protein [Nocardia vinacea]|nr:hypothetical protein [Nocardia vinacea]
MANGCINTRSPQDDSRMSADTAGPLLTHKLNLDLIAEHYADGC